MEGDDAQREELDRMIEQLLFGWTPGELCDGQTYEDDYDEWHCHECTAGGEGRAPAGHVKEPAMLYSLYLSSAWKVVEEMGRRGIFLYLANNYLSPGGERGWLASFWGHDGHGYAGAATAPEAICRAALDTLTQPISTELPKG